MKRMALLPLVLLTGCSHKPDRSTKTYPRWDKSSRYVEQVYIPKPDGVVCADVSEEDLLTKVKFYNGHLPIAFESYGQAVKYAEKVCQP